MYGEWNWHTILAQCDIYLPREHNKDLYDVATLKGAASLKSSVLRRQGAGIPGSGNRVPYVLPDTSHRIPGPLAVRPSGHDGGRRNCGHHTLETCTCFIAHISQPRMGERKVLNKYYPPVRNSPPKSWATALLLGQFPTSAGAHAHSCG